MATTLSKVIMAHPARRAWALELSRELNAEIVWDEKQNVWDTRRRSLLAGFGTHLLCVQDDAVVPRGLLAACEKIIENVPPNVPISLYMGKARIRPEKFSMMPVVTAGRQRNAVFAVFPGPWWGVGIILPTADIETVVAYGDAATHANDDIRIAQFYDSQGVACYYTLPSIVDHRSGPSLIGRRGSQRHALWRLDRPLTDIDWSAGSITPADMNLLRPFPTTP